MKKMGLANSPSYEPCWGHIALWWRKRIRSEEMWPKNKLMRSCLWVIIEERDGRGEVKRPEKK